MERFPFYALLQARALDKILSKFPFIHLISGCGATRRKWESECTFIAREKSCAASHTGDYFPMQVGSVWRFDGTRTLSRSATGRDDQGRIRTVTNLYFSGRS